MDLVLDQQGEVFNGLWYVWLFPQWPNIIKAWLAVGQNYKWDTVGFVVPINTNPSSFFS